MPAETPVVAVWVAGRREETERYVTADGDCPACAYVQQHTDLQPFEVAWIDFESRGEQHTRRVERTPLFGALACREDRWPPASADDQALLSATRALSVALGAFTAADRSALASLILEVESAREQGAMQGWMVGRVGAVVVLQVALQTTALEASGATVVEAARDLARLLEHHRKNNPGDFDF